MKKIRNMVYDDNGKLIRYMDEFGYIHRYDHENKLESISHIEKDTKYLRFEDKEDGSRIYTTISKEDFEYIRNNKLKPSASKLFMDLGFNMVIHPLCDDSILVTYEKDLPSPEGLDQQAYVEIRFIHNTKTKRVSVDAIRRYRYLEYTNGFNLHVGDRVDIAPYLYPITKQIEEFENNIVDIYNEFKEGKSDEEV